MPQVERVEHRWVELDGRRVHLAEAGSGEPVLMAHGFPEHWYAWRKLIPGLSDRYRVICPDLRGFGWSDAPPGDYAKQEFADDLIALIEQLELGQVRLVGHDWGGVAGYFVCLRRPDLVSSYLALGTAHPWAPQDLATIRASWRFWYAGVIAGPLGVDVARSGMPGFARRLLRLWSQADDVWSEKELRTLTDQFREPARAAAAVNTYRTFLLKELTAAPYADVNLTVPTLHLHGADDPCVASALVRGWEDHATRMRLELIDGCGHFPAEERPELVLDRALELFGGAPSTAG